MGSESPRQPASARLMSLQINFHMHTKSMGINWEPQWIWPQFYDKKDTDHVDQQPETYSNIWTDDPMHCTLARASGGRCPQAMPGTFKPSRTSVIPRRRELGDDSNWWRKSRPDFKNYDLIVKTFYLLNLGFLIPGKWWLELEIQLLEKIKLSCFLHLSGWQNV